VAGDEARESGDQVVLVSEFGVNGRQLVGEQVTA